MLLMSLDANILDTNGLQEYDGRISFGTDTWTSPNHYTYVAITAHLEIKGQPIAINLDVVEVPEVCIGFSAQR